MLNNNYFLSPHHYRNNLNLNQNLNKIYSKLEKDIFKLINYLRTNSEKYLLEFDKYFQKGFLEEMINELNKIEKKLHPFIIKKELSKAGKDYLDFLIENNIDKAYFNSNNKNRNCFNLKERLSKYGERNGKIFESVIINSGCAEEIVNKLIKDEKGRKMILSQNMKYIGITCGFLPNWKSICTIIDIVQDFIAYKDMNTLNNDDNSIKIINTIEMDENEIDFENKKILKNLEKFYDTHDNLYNDYSYKSFLNNNNSNNLINSKENIKKKEFERKEKSFNIQKKKSLNHSLSRNNYLNVFNNSISEKSNFFSPLATYKSDAHLILNKNNFEIKKSLTSLKSINSNPNYNSNINKKFSKTCKNFLDYDNNIINSYNLNNTFYNRNKDINIFNTNSDNKKMIKKEIKSKNDKKKYSKDIAERIRGKEKIAILHELNEIKNKLKKEKEKCRGKSKDDVINIENNEIKNKNIQKKNITHNKNIKTEINEINNEKVNKNISFDFKSYNLNDKENNNFNSNINYTKNKNNIFFLKNDNLTSPSNIEHNKKPKSFFPNIIEINNLLSKKNRLMNKNLKSNLKKSNIDKKNIEEKNESQEKNKSKTDYENISFKLDNNISNYSETTLKQKEIKNNKRNFSEYDYDYDNEDYYFNKDKKEIKKLIRLYNKERIAKKNKINYYNTTNLINENINTKTNMNCNTNNSNKKSTATFFYSKIENRKEEKKIRIYKKKKLNISNSYNKTIKKSNTFMNNSYNNINTLKIFFPKYVKQELSFNENELRNETHKNILTENNNFNEKKRIYSYITNRFKILNRNRSHEKFPIQNYNKNIRKKKYLSDKNLIEKINYSKNGNKSNYNDNLETETNVNSDNNNNENNNDYINEILKSKGYNLNNKEINTNIIIKKITYNTNKNYVYKKNKINSENKNINYYNKFSKKNLYLRNKIKDKLYTKNNNNSNIYKNQKKYLIPLNTNYN